MRNQTHLLYFLFSFVVLFFSTSLLAQKEGGLPFKNRTQSYFFASAEVFPFNGSLQLGINVDNKYLVGLEANAGINFSNYILVAGEHFATKHTLNIYENRDQFGNEKYRGIFGFSLFGRFFIRKILPIDVGVQREYFIHKDASKTEFSSGEFRGGYVKLFLPSKLIMKKGRFKKKPTFGVKISFGNLLEEGMNSRDAEFVVMTNFWVRFYLTKFEGSNLK